MANTTIEVRIRPSVDTEDAVVCAKLLEIWLNGDGRRRLEVIAKETGESEINVIEVPDGEVPASRESRSKIDLNNPDTFPW